MNSGTDGIVRNDDAIASVNRPETGMAAGIPGVQMTRIGIIVLFPGKRNYISFCLL